MAKLTVAQPESHSSIQAWTLAHEPAPPPAPSSRHTTTTAHHHHHARNHRRRNHQHFTTATAAVSITSRMAAAAFYDPIMTLPRLLARPALPVPSMRPDSCLVRLPRINVHHPSEDNRKESAAGRVACLLRRDLPVETELRPVGPRHLVLGRETQIYVLMPSRDA